MHGTAIDHLTTRLKEEGLGRLSLSDYRFDRRLTLARLHSRSMDEDMAATYLCREKR